MIVPIGDTPQPPRGFRPWLTWCLLVANVLVWVLVTFPRSALDPNPHHPLYHQLLSRLPPGFDPTAWDLTVERWGYIPAHPSALTLFTAMFLHANLAHLGGNALFLWIYGDNVEHRLGRVAYLATYLGTGAVATLAFSALATDPTTPLIGASGAISGILGCYFVMFPRNRVKLLVGLFPLLFDVWLVPAPIVLAGFVLIDNLVPFLLGAGGSVAYGAHLGGFVAGFLLALAVEFASSGRMPADGPDARAAAHLAAADALMARGQTPAAYQHYLAALSLTDDPVLVARARRGLEWFTR